MTAWGSGGSRDEMLITGGWTGTGCIMVENTNRRVYSCRRGRLVVKRG
jgi:hypothetical protein